MATKSDAKPTAKSNEPRETVTLTDNATGQTTELPLLSGTIGPKVMDIRKLYNDLGVFTFDPGYTATGSCESKITYIDGDEGVLLYRGYPIEELAEHSDFMEVAYLLLFGELPTAAEKTKFSRDITLHTMVHEQIAAFFRGFRRDAHPMAVLCGVVGALSAFYHDSTDISDPHQRMVASYRLIAKMPTIAAMAFKYSIGQPFMYPKNDLSYAENFLHMTYAVPCEPYQVNPVLARAMDRIFILHMDHEQNASTSTVRLAGSSGANPFACIAAGIASLWGPAHGGANEAVLKMLNQIGSKDRVPEFVKRAQRSQGHRSCSWASATACTRITTHARRCCGARATRCWTSSACATSRSSISPWSSSASRCRTIISSSASSTRTSISIRASS